MDPVKISSLELSNVKRIRALEMTPTKDGLTVIGGRNGQGKTSVLDAIAWALGGNKMKPQNPNRDGGATPAKLHVELSNGIVVERRGKNGTLHVTDKTGMRGTQKLLDEFLSALALDLPKFLGGTDKQRTDALLQTLGIDQELSRIDGRIRAAMEDRTATGREMRAKRAHADSLPHHDDAPTEPLLFGELSAQLMEAGNVNMANRRKRMDADSLAHEHDMVRRELDQLREQVQRLEGTERDLAQQVEAAQSEIAALVDVDVSEIRAKIDEAEGINAKVRDNQRRAEAEAEAESLESAYETLTQTIESLRHERTALLDGAPLPLEGLSINEEGTLVFGGQVWSDMSGSEQLRVATAIVRATKPECGFVLVDKLEQMDAQTLREFGEWAEVEGLQVIGTRVSTGGECTVVIEDGRIEDQELPDPVAPDPKGEALTWGGASF